MPGTVSRHYGGQQEPQRRLRAEVRAEIEEPVPVGGKTGEGADQGEGSSCGGQADRAVPKESRHGFAVTCRGARGNRSRPMMGLLVEANTPPATVALIR